MNNFNMITGTDGYKFVGHNKMLPEGTKYVQSYFEARKGAMYPKTMFVGLQPILKDYLCGVVITTEMIDKAERLANRYIQNGKNIFDRERWDYIVRQHGGRLPIVIYAVPEGTLVDIDNVLMTVQNTDSKCAWLTGHLETILTHVWYTCTVGTKSYYIKELFKKFLNLTSDEGENFGGINFMLHDFGFRGTSSFESAQRGGMAHMVNFDGTDTLAGIEYTEDQYCGVEVGMSVIATEHSIMTAMGRRGEWDVVKSLFDEFQEGILSLVIDSYDYKNFVDSFIGDYFKQNVLDRDGVTVLRPDSGEPVPTVLYILNSLEKNFGSTVNGKGFKVLNPKVRVLWGDGIDTDGIESILMAMVDDGWSTENIIFGMGGHLLQGVNRDTQRFAFKASAQYRDGEWTDVYKEPLDKSKASKKGRQRLIKVGGQWGTTNSRDPRLKDELEMVFLNGKLVREYNFNEVRENSKK